MLSVSPPQPRVSRPSAAFAQLDHALADAGDPGHAVGPGRGNGADQKHQAGEADRGTARPGQAAGRRLGQAGRPRPTLMPAACSKVVAATKPIHRRGRGDDRHLGAVRMAVEHGERADHGHGKAERPGPSGQHHRPSTTTDSAIPARPEGSAMPAAPSAPPSTITATNVAGTAQSARPPSCAANRPTATMASTWSRPPIG